MTLDPLVLAALLALIILATATATYWYLVFHRVLPAERDLRRSRGHADDLKMFSLDILEGGATGHFPRALGEVGQRALEALHRVGPELYIWWISSDENGGLVAMPGAARVAAASEKIALDSAAFEGDDVSLSASSSSPNPLVKSLADRGMRRVRLLRWGGSGRSRGILAAGDPDRLGRGLVRVAPFLDIAKPLAGSMAAIVDNLDSLHKARENLQGGLSATIENLTDTHSRLIQKSRQIKTLHDVASTLTSHTAQAQTTLSAIVSIVAKSLTADMVAFLLIDEATGELVTQPGAYGLESDDMLYRISLGESQSSTVRTFKTGEPFITGDAQNDPRVLARYAKLWRTRSMMVIPLKVEDRSIGVMRIGSYHPDYFTSDHLELMTVIAREAAVIVETAMLNRRLLENAEQLTELNRIKDDFVSTVSHEFKTPLTTIMGFLTVIIEGETGALNEQQGKFLGIAMGAAKRLKGLVADLLDMSRLESGTKMKLEKQPLDTIIKANIESYQQQAADGGRAIVFEISQTLPEVVCDERWIGLTLDNLVSNAIKFTRPGGQVRVEVLDKGEFVMVSVADDGIGIPAEDKDRIFEKFYRASNRAEVSAPGTGLGLAIAKEVVSKHGGKIWFESDAGRGSKFFFILKAAPRGEMAVKL